ncbi:MAG: ABC transporter permease [Vulcanimicrobiaceae bacterium]
MIVLRNLRSRLARTSLTVAGIAIGMLALVVVGSLAERLQTIVTRSAALNTGAIFAFANPRELFAADARARMLRSIAIARASRGVRDVVPEVVVPYATGFAEGGRFGPPSLIFGFPYEARKLASTFTIDRGADFGPRERRVAVVGADFASSRHARVGDVVALYGNSFTVVGTIEKSFTIFDAAVVVPLADAQALLGQLEPPTAPAGAAPSATALMILVATHADTNLIAHRISLLTGLQARDPAEVAGGIAATTQIFDAIVFGSALIALLVGAFSIVNTMTIAVSERTREIGIRKAIGASDLAILQEFIAEAAVIGTLGGTLGLAVALVLVGVIDARSAAAGNLELFAVTPRLGFGALAFATLLSVAAGLLPAIRAARLDPTDALRRGA